MPGPDQARRWHAHARTKSVPLPVYMPSRSRILLLLLLVAPFLYFIAAQHRFFQVVFTSYFLGVNVLTFFTYVNDKRNALRKGYRTSETKLHTCALIGGWPAAVLAVAVVRHKVLKVSFQLTLWSIVVAWQAGWWLWFSAIKHPAWAY